jgi:hypothetical protein
MALAEGEGPQFIDKDGQVFAIVRCRPFQNETRITSVSSSKKESNLDRDQDGFVADQAGST